MTWRSLAAVLCVVAGCARPQFPAAPMLSSVSQSGAHAYELERTIPGVGEVRERVISRPPQAVAAGACAGTVELAVPGAPGGAQYYTAHVACPDGNNVRASRKDTQTGQLWLYRPTLDQMMRARGVVLADRSDGVRWFVPDAVYESLSWAAVVHARGHAHPESAEAQRAQARQMVVALGMHSGFPGPGTHWDDVHVALLDESGNLLARLMMDASDVGTHAGIQIQRGKDGEVTGLAFVGLMRDAAAQWRFVDLWLPVKTGAIKPPRGVGAVVDAVATARTAHLLKPDPDRLGHLWVDGVEWLSVDALAGSLDQVTHRPGAVIGGEMSVNPAPEQGPMFMLTNVDTGRVRLQQDRTWMGDTDGMLLRVPSTARNGWSHVHEVVEADGTRVVGEGRLTLAQMPYTQRTLRFPLPTGQYVRVQQELVGVKADGGAAAEYGLRQIITFER